VIEDFPREKQFLKIPVRQVSAVLAGPQHVSPQTGFYIFARLDPQERGNPMASLFIKADTKNWQGGSRKKNQYLSAWANVMAFLNFWEIAPRRPANGST